MRIVYYTLPPLLDVALPFIAEMSRRVELHVVMQIQPGAWRTSMFDLEPQSLPPGLSPAGPVMAAFPPQVRSCWADAASFQLAVYGGGHSLHPDSLRTAFQTVQHIRSLRPDIVHLETTIGRIGPVLPRLKPTPLVMTIHDPEPHSGEATLKKRLIRRLNFSLADHFILHNRSQVGLFCTNNGFPPERVHYTPLGALDLYRQWGDGRETADRPIVLFFGRISPYKGLEDLFEAIPLVNRDVRNAKFVIAGQPIPGYSLPPLPQAGDVEMLDTYITNADLARLFEQASLVVCPYRDATQSAVVLTAYAFGKPVIATTVGGLPEYVDGGLTGELVPPRNPVLLAGAISGMLRRFEADPAAAETCRQAIRQKCATGMSWATIADKTVKIYEQVCA